MSISKQHRNTLQPELHRDLRSEPSTDAAEWIRGGSAVTICQRCCHGVCCGSQSKGLLIISVTFKGLKILKVINCFRIYTIEVYEMIMLQNAFVNSCKLCLSPSCYGKTPYDTLYAIVL